MKSRNVKVFCFFVHLSCFMSYLLHILYTMYVWHLNRLNWFFCKNMLCNFWSAKFFINQRWTFLYLHCCRYLDQTKFNKQMTKFGHGQNIVKAMSLNTEFLNILIFLFSMSTKDLSSLLVGETSQGRMFWWAGNWLWFHLITISKSNSK